MHKRGRELALRSDDLSALKMNENESDVPSGLRTNSTEKTPTINTSILVRKRESVSCSVFVARNGEGPEGSGLYLPNIKSRASCFSPSRKLLR